MISTIAIMKMEALFAFAILPNMFLGKWFYGVYLDVIACCINGNTITNYGIICIKP